MAIATSTAIILGGAAALSAGTAAYGAHKQSQAAKNAAKNASSAGQRGYDTITAAEQTGRADINAGYAQGRSDLQGANTLLDQQQRYNEGIFAQERGVGSSALSRLQDAILNGNQDAVQLDPGYQFRLSEGNKAIERAAAAAGSFGSGGNLKDFSRFNQGLASEEYGKAINRLMGLQAIGSQANSNLASLNTGLAGNRASILGALAANAQNQGMSLSNLTQNSAFARANALNNQATNTNNANLQASNAIAFGAQQLGSTANSTAQNMLLLSLLGKQGTGASQGAYVPGRDLSLTTPGVSG